MRSPSLPWKTSYGGIGSWSSHRFTRRCVASASVFFFLFVLFCFLFCCYDYDYYHDLFIIVIVAIYYAGLGPAVRLASSSFISCTIRTAAICRQSPPILIIRGN